MDGVQEGVKSINEMTPLQKLRLISDMMQTYGFNPINDKADLISLKLNVNEGFDSNSIQMEPFDLAEYINYIGQFGKIEENLNLMRKYLDEQKVPPSQI